MNINISQANNGGWPSETQTIYLTMPLPSPHSDLLTSNAESPGPNGSNGDGNYACDVCHVQFQTRSQLMGHTRKHMKDKLFQCKFCEQNFPTHKELKGHMGDKTESDEFSISCGICGRSFPSQACLTHHLNCHKQQGSAPVIIDNPAEERSMELGSSGAGSLTTSDGRHYEIQIKLEDPLDGLDPSSYFGGQQSITVVDDHGGQQVIELPQLQNVVVLPPPPPSVEGQGQEQGQMVNGLAANTVEIVTNSNNHRYSCSLCNKTFKNSQHVQRHLRIHTGEKPFSCSVCSQSFSLNHNLQRHMRTHTGEKPHKCPVCTKEFAEGHNLKRHMISAHDGPTPYVCSICSRKFAENSILKKHQNKAHKGQNQGTGTNSGGSSAESNN